MSTHTFSVICSQRRHNKKDFFLYIILLGHDSLTLEEIVL